jgi:uncharacterized protein YjfI (DUF2170 family)
MKLQDITKLLDGNSGTGLVFNCTPVEKDEATVKISIQGREELPIFLSVTETQILLISYLWGANEVKEDQMNDMHISMLEMNILIPLSSFGKIGKTYVVFGALANTTSLEEIEMEIATLSNNSIEIITEMSEFLI